jgi:hypothetical protein
VQRWNDFLQAPATPAGTHHFEREVEQFARELGRQTVEHAYNAVEPSKARELPPRVRVGLSEYRRNRKTPRQVATLLGEITLERCIYQAVEPGEPGLVPLEEALGIVAGLATPALADEAARLTAELPQRATCQALAARHSVAWADGTLRKVVAAMAENLAPHRHGAQVEQLLTWLAKATKSRGKHAPTLAVGRDGVMVPMRPCWEEASTATVSIYDRSGHRLGTVYLGRMPELGQGTLTSQLTQLLVAVLTAWQSPLPRLVYVTDAGNHPQDFFRRVLRRMKHPRTGERLAWQWLVDYYHACERITKLAEALFGSGREAAAWAAKQRRVLRDKPSGVARLLASARTLRRRRDLVGCRKDFDQAAAYLAKYARHMRYAQARRRQLPIGSGVTEAACKTLVGQRFKQSGMRWKTDHGQHVLDLRVLLKSGVWSACRTRWLAAAPPSTRATLAHSHSPTATIPQENLLPA